MTDNDFKEGLLSLSPGAPKCYSKRDSWGSFKVDPELWSRFKGECKIRGVSICHVLEALMEAWIEGQKAMATVIKPVTVNLTMQHIVERPRRMAPYPDRPGFEPGTLRVMLAACFRLQIREGFPGHVGFCGYSNKWIRAGECEGCLHQGEF